MHNDLFIIRIYAALLSAGRRDPEQTHSVTHSHTDTQTEQSQVERKTEAEAEEEGKAFWESLCIEHSLLLFLLQQDLPVSSWLSPDAAVSSGWAAMNSAQTHTHMRNHRRSINNHRPHVLYTPTQGRWDRGSDGDASLALCVWTGVCLTSSLCVCLSVCLRPCCLLLEEKN